MRGELHLDARCWNKHNIKDPLQALWRLKAVSVPYLNSFKKIKIEKRTVLSCWLGSGHQISKESTSSAQLTHKLVSEISADVADETFFLQGVGNFPLWAYLRTSGLSLLWWTGPQG